MSTSGRSFLFPLLITNEFIYIYMDNSVLIIYLLLALDSGEYLFVVTLCDRNIGDEHFRSIRFISVTDCQ